MSMAWAVLQGSGTVLEWRGGGLKDLIPAELEGRGPPAAVRENV